MKNVFLGALLYLAFISSSYGNVTNTQIVEIAVRSNDAVYIKTDPAPSSRAACATNSSWHYAFRVDSDGGKGILSLAIAAYTTKTPITIYSVDSCTAHSNMEDIDYLILKET